MEYIDDEQRAEALKTWWRENGSSIITGIVLGLAAIFGWQYWNNYRNTQAEQVSQQYDTFLKAVEKPDIDQAKKYGQTLLNDRAGSPYAALTALQLAKLAMDGDDLKAASEHLQWIVDHDVSDAFKDIARLRLARLHLATKKYAEAQKLLDQVKNASLVAEREELQGDLYLANNEPNKARTAYATALAANGSSSYLQVKFDNLTAPSAETVVDAPAEPPAEAVAETTTPETAPEATAPETATPEPETTVAEIPPKAIPEQSTSEPVTPAPVSEVVPKPVVAPAPKVVTEPVAAPTPATASEPTPPEPAPEPVSSPETTLLPQTTPPSNSTNISTSQ